MVQLVYYGATGTHGKCSTHGIHDACTYVDLSMHRHNVICK